MAKPKIYIDGQAGTTGLQIVSRISRRDDLELLLLEDDQRHNEEARKQMMDQADLIFLCLPDAAAIEAAGWIAPDKKVIDTSTAHRTVWTYGFPELDPALKEEIKTARRVANPGCHASGAVSLIYPLVKAGLLKTDALLPVFSLTGFSGGGKKMIAGYETAKEEEMNAPALYALGLSHKHIPEITKICHLEKAPVFVPIVDDYRQGMLTNLQLDQDSFVRPVSREDILKVYQDAYENSPLIEVHADSPAKLYSGTKAGKDSLEIFVNGNQDQFLISARFDNLGKGACGAALQNMNLMLGLDEKEGLVL
ncbi:MAG: N-acetyl-gamma-glutamyl-phosphate reductase [Erysipelotrichaceae bacterium]|nr:N-acetyl-gamma-glutamyl-phosphate reductase [Erysipelotrichaceae bacterium]